MASVNLVILVGNLGQDPEMRYTQGGQPVCNLRLATTEEFKGKDGEKKESTEWHTVVVWGKSAENCTKFLHKGSSVYVEGRIRTRAWEDKDTGKKNYKTEIVAVPGGVKFLDRNNKAPGPVVDRDPAGSDDEMPPF